MRQNKAEPRQSQRANSRHDENNAGGGLQIGLTHVFQEKVNRKRHGDPTNGTPKAYEAEVLLRVLEAGQADRIGNRQRGNVKNGVDERRVQKQPETVLEQGKCDDGQASDQLAKAQKLFRREAAVGKLIAEENRKDRCDGKGVEDR